MLSVLNVYKKVCVCVLRMCMIVYVKVYVWTLANTRRLPRVEIETFHAQCD